MKDFFVFRRFLKSIFFFQIRVSLFGWTSFPHTLFIKQLSYQNLHFTASFNYGVTVFVANSINFSLKNLKQSALPQPTASYKHLPLTIPFWDIAKTPLRLPYECKTSKPFTWLTLSCCAFDGFSRQHLFYIFTTSTYFIHWRYFI